MMRFEILPGLPPYGPMAISFSDKGPSEYREGFVVRFYPKASEPWVGNFLGSYGACNAVLDHPNDRDVIVVARGQGNVIDPESHTLRSRFGGDIEEVIPLLNLKIIVFRTWYGFEAIAANGPLWRSLPISTDGIRNVRVSGTELRGEGYECFDSSWHPFTLDLLTGQCADVEYLRARMISNKSFLTRWRDYLVKWLHGTGNT